VLGAGDAGVGLVAPCEDAPAVDAWDFRVDSETPSHDSRFYPWHLATAINARHGLASTSWLVQTPFLAHFLNHTLVWIAGYNRLGNRRLAQFFSA